MQEEELKDKNKFVRYFVYFLSFSVPFLLFFETWVLLNTVNVVSFFKTYIITGIFVVAGIIYIFYKKYPYYIDFKNIKRRKRIIMNYICLIFYFVYGAAFLNYFTAKSNIRKIQVKVVKKSKSYKYSDRYIYFNIYGRTEKFEPSNDEWSSINEGEAIWVGIGKGLLGYECITSFNTKEGS